MPTDVTLVMPYYENAGMLTEHYRLLRMLPDDLRAHIHFVVVDDGSPTAPALIGDPGVPLQIWRLKVDVRWNQDAARNIGVKHAPTPWVLMTDMDHIVPRGTWRKLIEGDWDAKNAYSLARVSATPRANPRPRMIEVCPLAACDDGCHYPECALDCAGRRAALAADSGHEPDKPHPNSWFLHRSLFERVGGYDERFAGYYGTDGDFKVRLLEKAKSWVKLEEYLIRVPREVIPDASTTSYARKEHYDRPEVQRLLKARPTSYDPRPQRFRFPYERVA